VTTASAQPIRPFPAFGEESFGKFAGKLSASALPPDEVVHKWRPRSAVWIHPTTAGADTFAWDYTERLTTANVGGTCSSYTYDGDGTRVSKTVGEVETPNPARARFTIDT
jgi:hypothetical protein